MIETKELFATCGTADQVDAGIGVIWWATHPAGEFALTVLDYQLDEMSAVGASWLGAVLRRGADLVVEHAPAKRNCLLRVEHAGVIDVLKRADAAYRTGLASDRDRLDRSTYDVRPVNEHEAARWQATLDERMFDIRPLVNSGKVVKLETGLRRFSFRAIRTNHLVAQIKRHRPGDAASAGELLQAFVLGVLLGTAPRRMSVFGRPDPPAAKSNPSTGPFGAYVRGGRPL